MADRRSKWERDMSAKQMSLPETVAAIKLLGGQSFSGIDELLGTLNTAAREESREVVRQVVRDALTQLGVTTTGKFVVPGQKTP